MSSFSLFQPKVSKLSIEDSQKLKESLAWFNTLKTEESQKVEFLMKGVGRGWFIFWS
jgi:hypothetical protein